jgi:superfamily II DNA or RNA helicase
MQAARQPFLRRGRQGIFARLLPVRRPKNAAVGELDLSLSRPQVCLLDVPPPPAPATTEDLALRKSRVCRIVVPPALAPQTTKDLCLPAAPVEGIPVLVGQRRRVTCPVSKCGCTFFTEVAVPMDGRRTKLACPTCSHRFEIDLQALPSTEDLTRWFVSLLDRPEILTYDVDLSAPRKSGKEYGDANEDFGQTRTDLNQVCIHGAPKWWCSICQGQEREERDRRSSQFDVFDLILPILQPPLGDRFDDPVQFPKDLKDFQRAGVKFLAEHNAALLADEMGLGKTVQAITAARLLFRMGKVAGGLVLCPRSVLADWERHLHEWAPELRVEKVRGTKEQRRVKWSLPAHVYLTTYESLRQDLSGTLCKQDVAIGADGSHVITCPCDGCSQRLTLTERLFGIAVTCPTCKRSFTYNPLLDTAPKHFDLVVLDEAQRIKNPNTDISQAVRSLEAHHRWGLSGTPLENRLDDLVSIFAYLKPGLLRQNDAARPAYVKESIKPYLLRRRKAEAMPEMPEKKIDVLWLDLTQAQRETYDRAEREGVIALNEAGDSATVTHVLALITKLKQICNMDPVTKESCKLEYLADALADVTDQGDKALVFSQYPEKTLAHLETELSSFAPRVFSGSLSDNARVEMIESFKKEDGDCRVLLMSSKAGGLGLNLEEAHYVFHYDLWWNPATAKQAEDRAHRMTQTRTVFVYTLLTNGTIEERIHDLIADKTRLFNEVVDDLSDTDLSKALSEQELFGLFGLRKGGPRASEQPFLFGDEARGDLAEVSPQAFERIVAELYRRMGYDVRLTPQTRDKGIDIYARRATESGTEQLAIQCKRYEAGVVGVEHARALYGVMLDQPAITRGVLATNSRFSNECRTFAGGKRIELIDGVRLTGLLAKYDVRGV